MRKTVIAAIGLFGALLSTASAAYADCGQTDCNSWTSVGTSAATSGNSYSHTGSSYNYSMSSPSYSSVTSSASAPLSSYAGSSGWSSSSAGSLATMSNTEARQRYGSGSISTPYTMENSTVVPFTSSSSSTSGIQLPGLGSNETLVPTTCPVSVYNPNGGKVLGCYAVAKPQTPVIQQRTSYHSVRVIRPIIYVRYPVPVYVGGYNTWNNGWYNYAYQQNRSYFNRGFAYGNGGYGWNPNGWGHGGQWGNSWNHNGNWDGNAGQGCNVNWNYDGVCR